MKALAVVAIWLLLPAVLLWGVTAFIMLDPAWPFVVEADGRITFLIFWLIGIVFATPVALAVLDEFL
jgi:hypothetical protein